MFRERCFVGQSDLFFTFLPSLHKFLQPRTILSLSFLTVNGPKLFTTKIKRGCFLQAMWLRTYLIIVVASSISCTTCFFLIICPWYAAAVIGEKRTSSSWAGEKSNERKENLYVCRAGKSSHVSKHHRALKWPPSCVSWHVYFFIFQRYCDASLIQQSLSITD